MKNTTPYFERVDRRHKILDMKLKGHTLKEISKVFNISTIRVAEILRVNNLCGSNCSTCKGREISGRPKNYSKAN